MSLETFPVLKGLTFGTEVSPSFNTGISQSANGHETRTSYQSYPRWEFELSYEWLPNRDRGKRDLETIMGFFLERGGSFQSFLFLAPETPQEDMTILGTGNGATTSFQLTRNIGGFSEPAGGVPVKGDVQLYLDSVMVDYTDFELSDHRDIVFDTAPAPGVLIQAIYVPLFRVRFLEDAAQFTQFMSKLWELQQLSLKSVFS